MIDSSITTIIIRWTINEWNLDYLARMGMFFY